ncbi:nuclear transport factor 2 family protein [Streptomyces sp. NPDC006645]|uniref:nuclear transport factor 2 family protein n=1 Tax=unclassified Streptomyces TaxID=2593676 RepID=UPI0033B343D2
MPNPDLRRAAFEEFLDGMHHADVTKISRRLAENVVVNSPILEEAISGHEKAAALLGKLSSLADDFTVHQILVGETHLAAAFGLRVGETALDGIDYVRFDADNNIVELSVYWRPLPRIVKVQQQFAAALGAPALELVIKE